MTSVANRANPLLNSLPHFLTWPSLGFRTICSGRMGFSSLSSHNLRPDPEPDAKVLETFTEEFEIGSRLIKLETGKMARFANGAVVLGMDGTKVLSTVCSAKGNAVKDFLPLTVEYQEKQFAHGMIPNTFMKREGAPKERELLCGRIIDRPIRPLFPKGFYHEVQVTASVLSSDGKQDPDVMAANAASAALMLSDIPWGGPIGMIRIGRIEGRFIVNPTMDELSLSDLNLVYACTREKTLMIDVQAREISEKDLEAGLRLAHPEAVKYLEPQLKLAAKAGKHKKEYKLSLMPERTLEKVTQLAEAPIEAVFTDPSYGKFERGEALENITQDVKKALEEECDEESLRLLPKAVDTVRKKVVRRRIITEGSRLDGRGLDEVRPLYCEAGYLPMLHGSSLFSRGDTQVLCTVTLGAPDDAQHLESVVGPPRKRFMLHYSFPPFCINEVGKHGGLNRREVGHGTLAEKALLAVLPPEDEFPYTVRINSEVMASDGSTSMASVCGGSIALMDAGIPLRKHVAGVSVGLVSEVDQLTGTIKEYRILTDILGLEDHLGDMDFKIVGTQDGITAIQLDIKPAGIPLDIVCESLEAARKGRIQILEHMEKEISAPRSQDDRSSPRLVTLKYSNDAIRSMIGPLGAVKRKIEDETGARICVSDGTLTIVAKNQSAMDKVLEKVDFILGREIEIGGIYKGTVSSIKEYGAFVEFNGGQQGLLHISELSHEPVSRISDVVSVGQQISLMCIGQDVRGNLKFSLKATLPRPRSQTNKSVDKSVPSMKEGPKIWAASGRMSDRQEKQSSLSNELLVSKYEVDRTNSSTSTPPVLIRSVAKCDGEEKSSVLVQNSKTTSESICILKPDRNSFLDSLKSLQSHTLTSTDLKNREDPVTAKSLQIGTKVTGKVYQIRTGGLVLDLGGGIRGMYRFEANGKKDFEVNDELQVECVSFSSRGVPVMSLVNSDGLSLSDTFPQSQNYNSLDKSVPSMKEGPNICATSGRLSEAQENQSSLSEELPVSKYEADATNVAQDWPQGPSIANSDEEEKSTSLVQDCFQNTLKIWASSGPMSDEQEKQSSLSEEFLVRKYGVDKRSSSPSSLSDLIRNLAVKEEKSTCMVQNSKTTSEPIGGLESDLKSHRTTPKMSISFSECEKEGKSTGVLQESKTTSKPIGGLESDSKSQTTTEMSKSFSQKKGDKPDIASGTHTSNDLNNKGDPVTAKSLKLGTKVTGKVYQIPKGGWLVLDLGEGLRGTYRFKAKGKKDIQVNDELRVECVSFTSKGIPVMSVADDE